MKPTKAAEAKDLIARAKRDLGPELGALAALATDLDWRTREVAATVFVEASRKHPALVIENARMWAKDPDENLRRVACEGLRALARTGMTQIGAVLDLLRADTSLYVRKSVANVLRDASAKNPDEVLALARRWMSSPSKESAWILKNGLKKLVVTRGDEVAAILGSCSPGSGIAP